jgi:hypothetical protein
MCQPTYRSGAFDFSLDPLNDGRAEAMSDHDLAKAEPGGEIGSDGAFLGW